MRQNPRNAIMHVGHHNGVVSLWSPSAPEPLVSILVQKGPVQALAVDPTGNYMVTSGSEGAINIWDLRTYKQLYNYRTGLPATTVDISQKGIVALGFGSHVQTWKDMFSSQQDLPYLVHQKPGSVVRVCFMLLCVYSHELT
jgi:U3 small nucleolar RNA-associated protein 7